jgi:hypothetical protein
MTVYADTLTAAYDTSITVFTGTCAALTCVTVNDDIQGSPFHSKVAWVANGGQDYFILVHGFGSGSVGTFTLNVTCNPTPSNDNCGSATAISGPTGSLGGTLVGGDRRELGPGPRAGSPRARRPTPTGTSGTPTRPARRARWR